MINSGVCLFETESLQWGDYNYCNKDFFFFCPDGYCCVNEGSSAIMHLFVDFVKQIHNDKSNAGCILWWSSVILWWPVTHQQTFFLDTCWLPFNYRHFCQAPLFLTQCLKGIKRMMYHQAPLILPVPIGFKNADSVWYAFNEPGMLWRGLCCFLWWHYHNRVHFWLDCTKARASPIKALVCPWLNGWWSYHGLVECCSFPISPFSFKMTMCKC